MAFAGFGATALLIGFAYYFLKPGALSYGILYGLGLIGGFQILVGFVRFVRTFSQYDLAFSSNRSDGVHLKTKEFQRITSTIERLKKMRKMESIIFVITIIVFAIGWGLGADKFLLGTAAGLSFQAAGMLVFDLFSQSRVQEYQHQIGKLVEGFKSEYVR